MGSSLNLFMFKRLLLLLSCFYLITRTNSSSSMPPQCHEDESSALLQFKHSFILSKFASRHPSAYPKVESWKLEGEHGDCCSWYGIECDEITGHVIGLDLSSSILYGSINSSSSLFSLVHLQWLNLADNHFNYSKIPSGIRHLSRLTSLNLSSSVFCGQIPSEISELSNLASLDISDNLDPYSSHGLLKLEKPSLKSFVQNITNLKELYLTKVAIYSAVPDILANFSSLIGLALGDCGLYGEFPVGIFLLPNLHYLRVSNNTNLSGHLPEFHHSSPLMDLRLDSTNFSGQLPASIGNLESLNYLVLNECKFSGTLPASLGNLTHLTVLNLGKNKFSGPISPLLTNITQLTYLSLEQSQLQGPIPSSFYQLKCLEYLDLSSNNLSGKVEMDIFLQLQNLSWLQLSENKLTVLTDNITNATLAKFRLLNLKACNLKKFPHFLQFQDELMALRLSSNDIHGQIPNWLWNSTEKTMQLLDISQNFLTGFDQNSTIIPWQSLLVLNLACNRLEGSLPIPPKSTQVYNFAGNMLSGEIPSSLCHNTFLSNLDLSNNNFSGTIPQCLDNISDTLILLNLSCNSFQGTIPEIFRTDSKLKMIDLSRNQLQGHVPRTLANCRNLEILVLGSNQIDDTFPIWLGALPKLQVLVLRHNKFHGAIENPNANLEFPKLRIIDLSGNSFSGNLPSEYFQKSTAMKMDHEESFGYMHLNRSIQFSTNDHGQRISNVLENNYNYSITITNKGTQRLYEKIQSAFVAIDLSSNEFRGEIPESMGNLKGLHMLNLSNNKLTGHIPSSLGKVTNLEALDLSKNILSGKIPWQLTQLTFLEVFDVSHNHLTGSIPRGAQFDTFLNNSFEGNSELCGDPLLKRCGNSEASQPPSSNFQQDQDSWFSSKIYWIIIILGYGSGLTVGLVIGHSLTTRNHEWFVKTFARRQQRRRRQNKRE